MWSKEQIGAACRRLLSRTPTGCDVITPAVTSSAAGDCCCHLSSCSPSGEKCTCTWLRCKSLWSVCTKSYLILINMTFMVSLWRHFSHYVMYFIEMWATSIKHRYGILMKMGVSNSIITFMFKQVAKAKLNKKAASRINVNVQQSHDSNILENLEDFLKYLIVPYANARLLLQMQPCYSESVWCCTCEMRWRRGYVWTVQSELMEFPRLTVTRYEAE